MLLLRPSFRVHRLSLLLLRFNAVWVVIAANAVEIGEKRPLPFLRRPSGLCASCRRRGRLDWKFATNTQRLTREPRFLDADFQRNSPRAVSRERARTRI
jgi:hypothetical protein